MKVNDQLWTSNASFIVRLFQNKDWNQVPVFRIPKPKILDSISKNFLDSGFHYQKFPGFWNSKSFRWGDTLET